MSTSPRMSCDEKRGEDASSASGYLGQYVGVGSLLLHDRIDRMLPLDFMERRLAALVPEPRPLRAPPRVRSGGESHSGNGPEMLGRSGAADFDFAGVLGECSLFEDDDEEQEEEEGGPKSHLKLKKPPRPRAFFGGGGDMHELGSRSWSSS